MIVGLKNCIPYIISSSTQTKINADWFNEDTTDCFGILFQSGFNVRVIYSLWQPPIQCVNFQKAAAILLSGSKPFVYMVLTQKDVSLLWCCPLCEEHLE